MLRDNTFMKRPVVLHIPHSSTFVPEEIKSQFCKDDKGLQQELLRMTDHFTDDLFQLEGAISVVFPVSRLVVDVERFEDPSQESMESVGMGAVYTQGHDRQPLRHPLSHDARQKLIETYYHPHHSRLTAAVQTCLDTYGTCLIIDCHSFPSRQLPYEIQASGARRPPVCLGSDTFHTPDELIAKASESFERAGYDVTLDDPFAGSLVPQEFYRQDARVKSLMIELRRDLYMDEDTGLPIAGYDELKTHLHTIIAELISSLETPLAL